MFTEGEERKSLINDFMISLIILAAGKSARFPGNKLLYSIYGEPVIRKVVKTALKSKVDKLVIVLGYEWKKLEKVIEDIVDYERISIVVNYNFEEGMSSSVKLGLLNVKDEAEATIFHPADVCFITSNPINALIEAYRRSKPIIAVTSYNGRAGHPILFDKSLFNDILLINEENYGLKKIVNKHRSEILYVNVSEREILIDIDTLDQLEEYLGRVKNG